MPTVVAVFIAALACLLIPPATVAQTSTALPADAGLNQRREVTEKALESVADIERKAMVPMRDGVRLSTDIYRPKAGSGKYPTIFVRTPYNDDYWDTDIRAPSDMTEILEWLQRGYAYVLQSERGKYFSEGDWDILGAPRTDGYDALSWIAGQAWSNGKVGTIGCSSLGEWHMGVAAEGNPALTAMVTQGYGAGIGRMGPFFEQGTWYRGGALIMEMILFLYESQNTQRPLLPHDLSQADLARLAKYFDLEGHWPRVNWDEALKHLPVEDIMRSVDGPSGAYADVTRGVSGGRMIERTPNDPAWYRGGLFHDDMRLNVPTLWMASWFDLSAAPNIELFNYVRRTANPNIAQQQHLIIAPTLHCKFNRATEHTVVGELDMGDARLNYDSIIYDWFDHYLKGAQNGMPDRLPPVRYYTMGSNTWQSSDSWPPESARPMKYYLNSGGKANTFKGDGVLESTPPSKSAADRFNYDPADPVPTVGGHFCCMRSDMRPGSFDQRAIEARPDVLVYTSEPLQEGLEASGPIDVTLYVSSDRADTDFTVKIEDVYPDGRSFNLDDTIQRARYRQGYDKEVWMRPGVVYPVHLGPMVTSNYFAPGHRVRLEISSSSFPAFERNLNTGGRNYDETTWLLAHNVIHHSRVYPSSVTLMVIRK